MNTNREAEIREESLAFAIAAYTMVGKLEQESTVDFRNQIVDKCFHVSSLIAKAFTNVQNDVSGQFIANGLEILNDIIKTTLDKAKTLDEDGSISTFLHLAEELKGELMELLIAIKLGNSESFSLKLEPTCI